jgi:hypothetical protein
MMFEIEDSFYIHGRGLMLIPKAFTSVMPKGHPKPIHGTITVTQTNGTHVSYKAIFQIEHFSIVLEDGSIGGKFSLVALLPDATASDIPTGGQISVGEPLSNSIRGMIESV